MLLGKEEAAYRLCYDYLEHLLELQNGEKCREIKEKILKNDYKGLANYFKRYATNIQTNGLVPTLLFIYSKAGLSKIDKTTFSSEEKASPNEKESPCKVSLLKLLDGSEKLGDKEGALVVGMFIKCIISKGFPNFSNLDGLQLLKLLTEDLNTRKKLEKKLKLYMKIVARMIEAEPTCV